MTTAVVTIVHGRHDHLRAQLDGLQQGEETPSRQVIVAMDDPGVRAMALKRAWPIEVVDVAVPDGANLPLARARNVGAVAAITGGADVLVFLDVDCIPSPPLLRRYRQVAGDPHHQLALLCGAVAYLPPPGSGGYRLDDLSSLADAHPARPNPGDSLVETGEDFRLFWSLSFALTATTWTRIGGFSTEYVGYGGEDTDFAESAQRAGVGLRWVGSAMAYHQYHPVSTPPVEHVAAIVANAHVFYRRWGWWPMSGWLDQFARLGLIEFDQHHGWQLAAAHQVVRR